MKFKVGDLIIVHAPSYPKSSKRYEKLYMNEFVIEEIDECFNDDSGYWINGGRIFVTDDEIELVEVYNSPLYRALR